MVIFPHVPGKTSSPLPLPAGVFRLQTSRLAGFPYRRHDQWLHQMKLGDKLELICSH